MRHVVGIVAVLAVVVAGCSSSPSGTAPFSGAPSGTSSSSNAPASSSGAVPPSSTGSPSASGSAAPPTAGTPAAQPPVLGAPSTSAAAPQRPTDKGTAYLSALTAAGVPTSTTGATEIQIAQGVCGELAKGTPRAKLVGDLGKMGGLMTEDYAEVMVAAAETHYC